ncbi:MAG: SURF1 family protein [Pseudomonadota bacterium]
MGPARKLIIPAIAAAVALFILLNLGFWQLDRLAWKETLILQVEQGVSKPAVVAPPPSAWNEITEEDDYRHVSVKGTYEDGTVFYYTSLSNPAGPLKGPGVMAYSPFRTEGGWVVLVNRGFLPHGLPEEQEKTALVLPSGQTEISGLLRLSEKPNWTTPAPDEKDRIWFARDTEAMGDVLGVGGADLAPYSIDLDAVLTPPAGLPQAGETIVRFKNDHLGYALTWFGLAATLIGVFLTYAATVLWPRKSR